MITTAVIETGARAPLSEEQKTSFYAAGEAFARAWHGHVPAELFRARVDAASEWLPDDSWAYGRTPEDVASAVEAFQLGAGVAGWCLENPAFEV